MGDTQGLNIVVSRPFPEHSGIMRATEEAAGGGAAQAGMRTQEAKGENKKEGEGSSCTIINTKKVTIYVSYLKV